MAKDDPQAEDHAKEAKMTAQFAALLSQNPTEDELSTWEDELSTWSIAGLIDEITVYIATASEEERLTAEPLLAMMEASLRRTHRNHPQAIAALDSLGKKHPNT